MSNQQDKNLSDADEKLFFESTNGDSWYLGRDPETGLCSVKHVANPESGGHVSYLEIESFLSGGAAPEHQAFRRLMEDERAATILIAYDIHPTRGAAYDDLVEAIQSLGAWWHHLETVWIVRSDKTPEQIRDQLKSYIGTEDQIFISDITGNKSGWAGINEVGNSWLKENIDRERSSLLRPKDMIETRLANSDDAIHISELLMANADGRGGMLLGDWSVDVIQARIGDKQPIIIAMTGAVLLGVLLTEDKAHASAPPVIAMLEAWPGRADAYVYGPVCVERNARAQGVLEALYAKLVALFPSREAILFIRADNPRSLRAHLRLGMREVARFELKSDMFIVLSNESSPASR
jgi:hypothetical protein